eukprot:scpid56253/ scgid0285/ 
MDSTVLSAIACCLLSAVVYVTSQDMAMCGSTPQVDNSQVIVSPDRSNATYQCSKGYMPMDDSNTTAEILCLSGDSAAWTEPEILCIEVPDEPPNPWAKDDKESAFKQAPFLVVLCILIAVVACLGASIFVLQYRRRKAAEGRADPTLTELQKTSEPALCEYELQKNASDERAPSTKSSSERYLKVPRRESVAADVTSSGTLPLTSVTLSSTENDNANGCDYLVVKSKLGSEFSQPSSADNGRKASEDRIVYVNKQSTASHSTVSSPRGSTTNVRNDQLKSDKATSLAVPAQTSTSSSRQSQAMLPNASTDRSKPSPAGGIGEPPRHHSDGHINRKPPAPQPPRQSVISSVSRQQPLSNGPEELYVNQETLDREATYVPMSRGDTTM